MRGWGSSLPQETADGTVYVTWSHRITELGDTVILSDFKWTVTRKMWYKIPIVKQRRRKGCGMDWLWKHIVQMPSLVSCRIRFLCGCSTNLIEYLCFTCFVELRGFGVATHCFQWSRQSSRVSFHGDRCDDIFLFLKEFSSLWSWQTESVMCTRRQWIMYHQLLCRDSLWRDWQLRFSLSNRIQNRLTCTIAGQNSFGELLVSMFLEIMHYVHQQPPPPHQLGRDLVRLALIIDLRV